MSHQTAKAEPVEVKAEFDALVARFEEHKKLLDQIILYLLNVVVGELVGGVKEQSIHELSQIFFACSYVFVIGFELQ